MHLHLNFLTTFHKTFTYDEYDITPKKKLVNLWFNLSQRAFEYQPPSKTPLNFFAKRPLKSGNCPSTPFLDNPPYILLFCEH